MMCWRKKYGAALCDCGSVQCNQANEIMRNAGEKP